VIKEPSKRGQMEGRKAFEVNRQFRGGRSMRGRGGRWGEEVQQMNQNQQGNWGDRRGGYQEGRNANQHWRPRESEGFQRQDQYRRQQFDLRNNLNQARGPEKQEVKSDEANPEGSQTKDGGKLPLTKDIPGEAAEGKGKEEEKMVVAICKRCGKVGHKTEECYKPLLCPRCKAEGHVARACPEMLPWECIAPFCGLAAPELGFHIIQGDESGEAAKETNNMAVITIKEGEVTARQVEGEFKAQAGQSSTWRWFAKKVADKKFQMKFPTAKKVEELSFFTGMEMRTVPGVKFRVDQWNPHVGAKAEIDTAWFRIAGIPTEKRTERRVACVASLVGIPLEIDKNNLKRWEYV
jgi:hypothetical protein